MTADSATSPDPSDPLHSVEAELAALEQAEPADQVAIYERMHAALADALGHTVEQPGSDSGGR